ncbi:OmpP1/FadL family transporter [Flavobacterium sp. '19STA2R22 D10 B1']|uniref:OmpP1/FadL family transporter n=1 Tax=Flavobacterium aerium TaxID=3037261 RepID=UPI00278C5D5B|nr:outer membrane protein transport protein [Flavobacterium sp. '19STA2R22 D10 B1']
MKKYLLTVAIGLSFYSVQAQDISDAMRYSQSNLTGTARFRAMSGAFGALGGDLSSLSVNPAGSAVFANNQMAITVSNYNIKNKASYFGTKTSDSESAFDLNQLGAVFVFNNQNPDSDWKKFTLGVNYDNMGDFDNSIFTAGTNPTNSISQYFLHYANGVPPGALSNPSWGSLGYGGQQAFLAYDSYLIESNNDAGNTYFSQVPAGGNYYQDNRIVTSGYNGKLSFNIATQYQDRFYFGLNLNTHFTDYKRSSSFYESNNNTNPGGVSVQELQFNNELYTYGNGFSFQVGAIAKVTNEFRVGLAYESPTWYKLNDELSQRMITYRYDASPSNPNPGSYLRAVVDPNIVTIYQPYKLQTPGKYTGSMAYVFGKNALISVDYSLKDYSSTKYRPSNDPVLSNYNTQMANILDVTSEVRVGAEYRIKELSLRGGYRFEQSPYKNGKTIGDLQGFSGGLGYNFGSTKLDIAYSYFKRDYDLQAFSQGLTDVSNIKSVNNNITLTLGFEL